MATMVSSLSSVSDKDAGNDSLSGELTSLLMRLQDSVVHVTPERDYLLRTSKFERSRVETNLAYARDLFSRLEQSEHSAQGPARRMSIRGVLGAQQEMLDLLYDRLEDLKQMAANAEGEDSDSEEVEDLLPNYAPPPKQTTAPIPVEAPQETHILPPPTALSQLPEPSLPEPSAAPPSSLPPPSMAGPPISGPPKAGPPKAGSPLAGSPQAGPPQAGPPQAGPPQAGPPQAGPPRGGPPRGGPPKAGPPKSTPTKSGTRKASNRSRYIPVAAPTANVDQTAPESPPAPAAPIEPPTTYTHTTQTLRNRNEKKSAPADGASYTTARAALFAGRSKPSEPQTSTATAEAILDHQRQEQDALSESILKMAGALKESSKKFAVTLDEDKEIMTKAGESVEKTERSMESARGRMGTLRKMTEGKGWWGRLILYAWVYGLMLGLVLLVFVFPKLRF